MSEISEDEFFEYYEPLENNAYASYNGCMYETHGEELEFVATHDKNRIWTLMDSDDGDSELIIAGFWRDNRLGYFVSARPWINPDTFVLVRRGDYDEEEYETHLGSLKSAKDAEAEFIKLNDHTKSRAKVLA